MKARLLYPDFDFDWSSALEAATAREAARTGRHYRPTGNVSRRPSMPWNAEALVADLGLDTVFRVMANDDDCILEVVRRVILNAMSNDAETIAYRQAMLQDCLARPDVIRELYAIACTAKNVRATHYFGSDRPDSLLRMSVEILEGLFDVIVQLRQLADSYGKSFHSAGWSRFFCMLHHELDDAYLDDLKQHLQALKFRKGLLLSARLDAGNKGTDYQLHLLPEPQGTWLAQQVRERLPQLFSEHVPAYSFTLHPRDQSGFRALQQIKNRGIAAAADVLGQAADHVRSFFGALHVELAFYIGCINLHEHLQLKNEPLCMPTLAPATEPRLSARRLYDIGLALNSETQTVGNDVDTNNKFLTIITGANRGGKSTFLRSVGLAQLLAQSGMFVPALALHTGLCDGLFTHFKREEDAAMNSGKLDEELGRMSSIIDHITPYPMILFNESFAATNEREGSEIARQITTVLLEKRMRMFAVTHLYDFARSVYETHAGNALFLRADRQRNGTRTFKLSEKPPLETSYGQDLYRRIFSARQPARSHKGRSPTSAVSSG